MRATAEASNYYFEQKTKTIEIMTGYLGRPRNETEYAYDQYKDWQIGTTARVSRRSRPRSKRSKTIPQRLQQPILHLSSTQLLPISWRTKDTITSNNHELRKMNDENEK
jgi:hypothetical protein